MDAPSPARRDSGLVGLHGLEWRYDGPLPAEALDALSTTADEATRRRTTADGALVDRLALDALRAGAAHRSAVGIGGDRPAARLAACREAGLRLRLGRADDRC